MYVYIKHREKSFAIVIHKLWKKRTNTCILGLYELKQKQLNIMVIAKYPLCIYSILKPQFHAATFVTKFTTHCPVAKVEREIHPLLLMNLKLVALFFSFNQPDSLSTAS